MSTYPVVEELPCKTSVTLCVLNFKMHYVYMYIEPRGYFKHAFLLDTTDIRNTVVWCVTGL